MSIDINSDYTTNSTDLFQLLPEVFGSNTNRSVFSNLFNRFLSKDQTQQVVGYIGQGNPNAAVVRQIKEPTVHRQAFQLQPLMYSKIGTIEYIDSWYDILNELDRQGIDISQLPTWGNTLEFNWVPPIDINKIVNYRDYYWYDEFSPSSQPQYVTVKGICSSATSYVNFYQGLINQFGSSFNIIAVQPATGTLYVSGDFTNLFQPQFVIFIQNSTNPNINNSFQTVQSSTFNAITNQTAIILTTPFTSNIANGQISLQQQFDIYESVQTCQCSSGSGWDISQWDDNQINVPPPIWNATFASGIRFPTLAAWNTSNPSPPVNALFWNSTTDTLYSLSNNANPSSLLSFILLASNFSLIFNESTGTAQWDLDIGCGTSSTILGLDQWISQNKWLHKADVPNFTIAKQAAAPIIEFEPQLELNEWTMTTYNWQYRSDMNSPFSSISNSPNKFELQPLNVYSISGNTIIIDERFGDLTGIFIPGYQFLIADSTSIYTVSSCSYQQTVLQGSFTTQITLTTAPPGTVTFLYPIDTSQGDPWRGYNVHWLFDGVNNTTAINHQAENLLNNPDNSVVSGVDINFTYVVVPYAQEFVITTNGVTTLTLNNTYTPPNSTRTLQQRSLVGFDDIRVYRNGVRQYGNYDENGTSYVTGITFYTPLNSSDQVIIQVGEAAMNDLGNYSVPLRTIADDADFTSVGSTLISLVNLRKVEQIKVGINQYPLFDMYNTNCVTATTATEIFSYQEASDTVSGTIIPALQQRVVLDLNGNYMFQNWLVQTNNGRMYGYRNYSKSAHLYWFNTNNQTLYVWTGFTWISKYLTTSGFYTSPLVLTSLPNSSDPNYIDGILVFNTTNNTLNLLTGTIWSVLPVIIAGYDETIETIWRHGLNNEQYVPQQVDWIKRSFNQYTTQENTYIDTTVPELIAADPSLTQQQATVVAQTQWNTTQQSSVNSAWYTDPTIPTVAVDGIWVGNWEIPDPLYFNVDHENWQYISTQDLQAHFSSIVNSQVSIPAFTGTASSMWRLLSPTQINWGLGGTIKEYDNSFDTFLSTAYINTVIPPDLFTFAHDEYENAITTLNEYFQRNFAGYLTSLNPQSLITPNTFVTTQIINQYEENEAADLVYGDSTTFNSITNIGVKNWIATLPYFGIVDKFMPYVLIDQAREINSVRHHDGHYNNYSISSVTIASLQQQIINTPDTRTTNAQNVIVEKFGRLSASLPPSTQAAFIDLFSANIRPGVFWLNNNILYALVIAGAGLTSPPNSVPDGSLWIDTATTSLRIKLTVGNVVQWNIAPGFIVGDGKLFNGSTVQTSSVSAWQVVDLNQYFVNTVETVESQLYQQAPTYTSNKIDFVELQTTYPTQFSNLLQQQFNTFVDESEILTPFANSLYNPQDPFTWNYKYSICTQPPTSVTPPTGGDWRDVYQKAYGTPYPHLEPWILQGYTNKPTWWDAQFANDNPTIYGFRRWKHIHGLPVIAVGTNTLTLAGDQTEIFNAFDSFTVFSGAIQHVYITAVDLVLGNTIVTITTSVAPGTNPGDLIRIGMWDYILRGAVPIAQQPPKGLTLPLPTFSYLSVNITDSTFTDGVITYNPDDVFPPYFNYITDVLPSGQPINTPVRSLFFNFSSEINSENADYLWNDAGPVEWMWQNSTAYLYTLVTIAYLLQPIRTIQSIFGVTFDYVNQLPIDNLTGQVFSHTNTQFYGELPANSSTPYIVNGINQWYINYNRYSGIDSSFSDFRTMWTTWTTPLCYQFGGFVDTQSFQLYQRIVNVTPSDRNITLKKSPGVENFWMDTFNAQLISVPPNLNLYDTQSEWVIQLNSQSPISHDINYFDVQRYDFIPTNTTTYSLYTYPIVQSDVTQSTFSVSGDVSIHFGNQSAQQIQVVGSLGNNGIYSVISSVYNSVTNITVIYIEETIPSSAAGGTLAAINYRILPWNTGTLVSLETTEFLPVPLDLTKQYFIIVLTPTTFQLAYTMQDAMLGIPILLDAGSSSGIQCVGLLHNTFTALGGQNSPNSWKHYEIDLSTIRTFTSPYTITGMQDFINLIDGYATYIQQAGFGINISNEYQDPQTGQQVGWQNELERFIDWAYKQRMVQRQRLQDKYPVVPDFIHNELVYTSQNPNFTTSQQVVAWSFNGGLPLPLQRNVIYYIINNIDGSVSLASDAQSALSGNAISLTSTTTLGSLYLSVASLLSSQIPSFEINPIRNAVWFSPTQGIVSNILSGPYQNIHNQQLVFDQYGRRITQDNVRVFRQDKLTYIQFKKKAANDVNVLQSYQSNPYDFLHMGGANLFIDTYEHLLVFNNYTTADVLLYDPFLGVNTTKFELDFYKQTPFSERPNVGGYFLSSPNNQGAQQLRNIEATVNDIRYAYDTYKVKETLPLVQHARALLGYKGVQNYLTDINLTPKSQFLFWKGAIQAKGSPNAITAFVNSILFIDAGVDEFWAYKVADFGSIGEQDYPELYLNTTDTQSNQLRLEFVRADQICNPGYAIEDFGDENCGYANPQDGTTIEYNTDPTFIPIATSDQTRWVNQPDVQTILDNNGGSLYFNLKVSNKLTVTGSNSIPNDSTPGDAIIVRLSSGTQYEFWTNLNGQWIQNGQWTSSSSPIFRHNFKADNIIINYQLYPDGTSTDYIFGSLNTSAFVGTNELALLLPYVPLSGSLKVFINNVPAVIAVDYVESLELYPGSNLLGYKLYFTNPIQVSGTNIRVVYSVGQLNTGLQYNIINSNIVQLITNELVSNLFSGGQMTIWGEIVDKQALNPEYIIDTEANVTLSPITYWDPARGYHFYNGLYSVDLQTNTDPAVYAASNGWKDSQIGTTWLDTTNVDYQPYYDPIVMSVVDTRFQAWGQLTDYGSVRLFQWTKSDIPPSSWNAQAAIEQIDGTIDPSIRKSGTVRQDTVYRVRTTISSSTDSNGWPVDSNGNPSFIIDVQNCFDFDPLVDAASSTPVGTQTNYTFDLPPILFQFGQSVYTYVNGLSVSTLSATIPVQVRTTANILLVNTGTQVPLVIDGYTVNVNDRVLVANQVNQKLNGIYTVVDPGSTTTNWNLVRSSDMDTNSVGAFLPVYVYVQNGTANAQTAWLMTCSTGKLIFFVSNINFVTASFSTIMNNYDRLTVIRPVYTPTTTDLAFTYPSIGDNPLIDVQWTLQTNSVVVPSFNVTTNTSINTYYFWVENKTTPTGSQEAIINAVEDLITPPQPYLFFSKFQQQETIQLITGGSNYILPDRFVQAIVVGLRGYVNENMRYAIQFTRDFTLRDSLAYGTSSLQLKDTHQEWTMFRQNQLFNIPQGLWNKVIESIIGYTLVNLQVRVPSLNRQLYDQTYGAQTQYGLGTDQTFVNGTLALNTILDYLNRPGNTFQGVDINTFFENNSFDTPTNIITAMNNIYTTFSYIDVNAMFFEVLQDALTTQQQYAGLMKTSAVALYGIQLLDVSGAFDY